LAHVLESERIDIVCERNFDMTLLAALACHWRPTRRVSFVSSNPERDLADRLGRFGSIKRAFLKRAYRRADRVVAVSNGVTRSVCQYYGLSSEQVVTIPSSLDPERVARLAAESAPAWDPGRFHVVAVGRLHPAKGYPHLLEAIDELVHRRQLTQIQLWIVGEGSLHAALESEVQSRSLDQHVCLAGHQANPLPYVKRAQLFCLPSLYEGMPNALLEAVFCGTPVVASDCRSGPGEILDGGRLGRLVPPGDAVALADAIADAIANYPRWQSLTDEARRFAEERFSLKASVGMLEQLLLEVGVTARTKGT
jgi:glycosyltransferase involved in cell wall biosynthesis